MRFFNNFNMSNYKKKAMSLCSSIDIEEIIDIINKKNKYKTQRLQYI